MTAAEKHTLERAERATGHREGRESMQNHRGTARTRAALDRALIAAEQDNVAATRQAERAAAVAGRDLAGPCTDMLLSAYAVRELRRLLDWLDGVATEYVI